MFFGGNWLSRGRVKETVDSSFTISMKILKEDFSRLNKHEHETRLILGSLYWGEQSVGYKAVKSKGEFWLGLSYAAIFQEERQSKTCKIPVVFTRPNFGGFRWWFLCPRCGRRIAKVRKPPSSHDFACRQCHCLTYHSTREHPSAKRMRLMREIRKKLDPNDSGDLFDFFPRKPPKMHNKTYQQLARKYRRLEKEDWDWILGVLGEPHLTLLSRLEDEAERKEELLREIEDLDIWEIDKPLQTLPKRGTLGDVAQKAGVPYQFAKEAQSHGLISPDGKQDDKCRYRYKLASWLDKLHLLNQSGYSWQELRAWSKRRFKAGHEHERRYPAGFAGDL